MCMKPSNEEGLEGKVEGVMKNNKRYKRVERVKSEGVAFDEDLKMVEESINRFKLNLKKGFKKSRLGFSGFICRMCWVS